MTPEAVHVQFSPRIWQAVSEHAQRCVAKKEVAQESARVENLRPVYFEDEDEYHYGKQIWCFESMEISVDGRRRMLYGLMEFSIQYGLLESAQSGLFVDAEQRDQFLLEQTFAAEVKPSQLASTRVLVVAASLGVTILAAGWVWAWMHFVMTGNLRP